VTRDTGGFLADALGRCSALPTDHADFDQVASEGVATARGVGAALSDRGPHHRASPSRQDRAEGRSWPRSWQASPPRTTPSPIEPAPRPGPERPSSADTWVAKIEAFPAVLSQARPEVLVMVMVGPTTCTSSSW
jgi:hypothetical protein